MKLGVRGRLTFFALAFLAIPAMGYYSSLEIKGFLLRGQLSSQLLAAQAIASALKGRSDLSPPSSAAGPGFSNPDYYIRKAPGPIKLDGSPAEWGSLMEQGKRFFGLESMHTDSGGGFDPKYGGFELAMARWEGRIYLWIGARDETAAASPPGDSNPARADHLALTFIGAGDKESEYIVPLSPSGELAFWTRADPSAPYMRDDSLAGRASVDAAGYRMEIAAEESRIADSMRIKILLADVDDPVTGRIRSIIGPRGETAPGLLRLAYPESEQIQRILDELDFRGASAMVADAEGRERAKTGAFAGPEKNYAILARRVIAEGNPIGELVDGGKAGHFVAAGSPIKNAEGRTLGAVILERSAGQALSLQEKAVENSLWGATLAFLAAAFGLLLFSSRLAFRIHKLRQEAERAIDGSGRVIEETLSASRDSGDEIGDLSRSISRLLTKLRRHHDFLAILPRTLKHEINNPLNTITVSLENLAAQISPGEGEKYIKSAGRGAARLKEMVDSLAEAASVEDSIQAENFERIRLSSLLERYMENSARMDARHAIKFVNLAGEAFIMGSDFRIEQLLDKLMDNAADFCPERGSIEARLERKDGGLLLAFSNDGPPIPERMLGRIFDSLVSSREGRGGTRPHLGIGLYIARVIAESHGGAISAGNRPEGKGPVFSISFPAA